MTIEEAKKYFESLGMKYGKDFTDETIRELTDAKGDDKHE